MLPDPWRSLAKDGSRRAELRELCADPLPDFSFCSWEEMLTVGAVGSLAAGDPDMADRFLDTGPYHSDPVPVVERCRCGAVATGWGVCDAHWDEPPATCRPPDDPPGATS